MRHVQDLPCAESAYMADVAYLRPNASNLAPVLLHLRKKASHRFRRLVEAVRHMIPIFEDFCFLAPATALLQPGPPSLMLMDEPEPGQYPQALALLAELLKSAASRSHCPCPPSLLPCSASSLRRMW